MLKKGSTGMPPLQGKCAHNRQYESDMEAAVDRLNDIKDRTAVDTHEHCLLFVCKY
jgi:hypothetical protein